MCTYQYQELSVTSEQIALAGAEVSGMDRLTSRSKQRVFRSALRRTSMKLAEASDQLPSTLFLSGVELVHRDAVRGGAFADIFEGTYKGVKVALKRLRIFLQNTTTEHTRISRVISKCTCVPLLLMTWPSSCSARRRSCGNISAIQIYYHSLGSQTACFQEPTCSA